MAENNPVQQSGVQTESSSTEVRSSTTGNMSRRSFIRTLGGGAAALVGGNLPGAREAAKMVQESERRNALRAGFDELITDLEPRDTTQEPTLQSEAETEPVSFTDRLQTFRNDYLQEGGLNNTLYVTVKTASGVDLAVPITGNTEDVAKKFNDNLDQRQRARGRNAQPVEFNVGGNELVRIEEVTLDELLGASATIPGLGATKVNEVDLVLLYGGEELDRHEFRERTEVRSTSQESQTGNPEAVQDANVIDVQEDPTRREYEVGDTIAVRGVDADGQPYEVNMEVTQSGLVVTHEDGMKYGRQAAGLTDIERAAFSELGADYFMNFSDTGAIFNPIQVRQGN